MSVDTKASKNIMSLSFINSFSFRWMFLQWDPIGPSNQRDYRPQTVFLSRNLQRPKCIWPHQGIPKKTPLKIEGMDTLWKGYLKAFKDDQRCQQTGKLFCVSSSTPSFSSQRWMLSSISLKVVMCVKCMTYQKEISMQVNFAFACLLPSIE